jgi:hypothetical protein
MKFSALVEHVTKKPVPAHVTHFVVEVMASDQDGEDVEVRIRNCFSRHLPDTSRSYRYRSLWYASKIVVGRRNM